MNRTLISIGLCTIAALTMASPFGRNDAPAARKIKVGLQLYTVRDVCAKDFEGTLKDVAKAGFDGVEFAGYYGKSAEELNKMLKEDHLAVYGSHVPLSDLTGDKFEKTAEFNKAIGNPLIVVPWIPDEMRNTPEKLIETAKLFTDLASRLKKYGIAFGYHDHAGDFKKYGEDYQWDMLFANSSKDVKMQFDSGNAMSAGVQAAPYLKKYAGRVISVHVKDFSATNKDALLGEGDVHWDQVIPLYKAKNGPKYFIIEQEAYPFPSIVCAQKCLETFKKMLGE